MTEFHDLDAIEAEARAYVDAYIERDDNPGSLLVDVYLSQLLAVVDVFRAAVRERDAEIAKWRADYTDTATCLGNERQRAGELLRERDAEIARLSGLATYDHGHNEPCLMCGKPCNSLAGNPGLWPLRLGNNGWHHVGCVNDALRELDRLRAPPGADAMEHAGRLIVDLCGGEPLREDDSDILPTARALQLYGDERAAAAREAALLALDNSAIANVHALAAEVLGDWRGRLALALQQHGDERAREATDQANMVYELHNRLVGHVEMDAESRAEWVMKQSLDGLHIGENNRGQTKDYLAGHFRQAMVDAQTAAREAAIEEAFDVASWVIHDIGLPATAEGNLELRTRLAQTVIGAIRALAARPGSEP